MASLGVAGPMLLRGNPVAAAARSAAPFSAGTVDAIARKLSRSPFQAPDRSLPPAIASLDYHQYRSIRFERTRAFWARSAIGETSGRERVGQYGYLSGVRVILQNNQRHSNK